MRRAILLLLLIPGWAFADDCRGNQPCGNTDVDVANDIITNVGVETGPTTVNAGDVALNSDSKTFAFSHGLGDVDINQCIASTQWGTILVSKQGVILNKWCAAETFDARGMHFMAAALRCDIKEISKHFESQEDCIDMNTYRPAPAATKEPAPEPTLVIPPEVLQFEEVEEEHDNLEHRLARLEANQRAAAMKAQQRREIAQQTYDKVKDLREDERDN